MEQQAPATRDAIDRAMRPFALPLGLVSPMWMAYGAAIGLSATWWWMSRMSRLAAPTAADAVTGAPPLEIIQPLSTVVEEVVLAAPPAVAPSLAVMKEVVAAAPAAIDTATETVQTTVTAAVEPLIEQVDELTLLRGVGPRVADALVARGVTTFAQLAAWTDADLAAFDAELKLLGRSKRYDFIGQAKNMMSAV